jgi:glycosyltransferase involved in cell wall biosynthesis
MKTLHIGINAYEANVVDRVGSNQYAYAVLVELERIALEKHYKVTIFLPNSPVADMPKERQGWEYRVIPPSFFWTHWRLPISLVWDRMIGKNYDVFLSLGHYAPPICPAPSVMMVMDLAYLQFPEFFKKSDVWKLTHWTDTSVRSASQVIAISEQTKKDILNRYHLETDQVTVAYPGFSPSHKLSEQETEKTLKTLGISGKYLVYVGTLQPRKNLLRLVQAFEMVVQKKEFKDLQLIIAGKIGWLADEVIEVVKKSQYAKQIRMLGYVTEEQKAALYAGSELSVLVGLYEGFGIPPLEAMAYGTIPVVSNTASLPEVVGDTGVLVDPYDASAIAQGLETVLQWSREERAKHLVKGKRQATQFTWEHTGNVIMDVLEKAGGK